MMGYKDNLVQHVRVQFADMILRDQFVVDKSGVKCLEIVGASFIADEDAIFGKVNYDYVKREIDWYESQSLKVADIPPPIPAIWQQVSGKTTGEINSNYGYLIFSGGVQSQYTQACLELIKNPDSRRAVMVYTRPSIWQEYNRDGMSDFICTNAVQYFIRDGYLDVMVQMRSNDAFYGYRNDLAWQRHVQALVLRDINSAREHTGQPAIELGQIYWNAGSLHVYERDFYLVDWYLRKGAHHVTKAEYRSTFPDSLWS